MKLRRLLLPMLALAVLSAWLAAGGGPLAATMVRAVSLEEAVDLSEAIVTGTVVKQRTYRAAGGLLTAVTVRVDEGLKGRYRAGDRIEVTAWGGELGGRRQVALGEAEYRKGERVLLQLERIDGRWHTLGLAVGKWNVVRGPAGIEHLVRSLAGLGVAGDLEMTEGPLPLDAFRDLVELRRSIAREGGRR